MNTDGGPILGQEADMDGHPLPPQIQHWVDTLPAALLDVINTLAGNGHGVWLVGGAVRDAWLGQAAYLPDIDLATTCEPEEMLRLFGDQAIPTGVDFGTVTVKSGGQHYEVTTLRTESLYRDGRRPDLVHWGGSLKEDLSRRDFTFNSMAIDLSRRLYYDPFNGAADLKQRVVRAVGNAQERCQEDALRILRAYRFLSRDDLGIWTMEASLKEAVKQLHPRLDLVAVERIWLEVRKILDNMYTGAVFLQMKRDGVLETILPHCANIRDVVLRAMDDSSLSILTPHQCLAMLMIEQPTKSLIQQLNALRTSKEFQRNAATFHEYLKHLPTTDGPGLRVFAHVLGAEADAHLTVRTVMETALADMGEPASPDQPSAHTVQERWSLLPKRQTSETCLIDGHWLMQRTGIAQGIRLGRLKQWLHRLQIEQDITTTQQMESLLSRLAFEHGEHESWPRLSFP